MSKKEKSFENLLNRLQEISNYLEDENISLDDSIKLYEEGINISKICYNKLNEAELKVSILKNQMEDNFKQSPELEGKSGFEE